VIATGAYLKATPPGIEGVVGPLGFLFWYPSTPPFQNAGDCAPPSVTRVHIRSNADQGFRLTLVPGPTRGLDSAADRRADSPRPPSMSVRTWQQRSETARAAEPLEVGSHDMVLRDTHSPLSLSEPVDLLVEFSAQEDFSIDAGEYGQEYQLVFEPRYSRATAPNVSQ